jgi:hypothetical protein
MANWSGVAHEDSLIRLSHGSDVILVILILGRRREPDVKDQQVSTTPGDISEGGERNRYARAERIEEGGVQT